MAKDKPKKSVKKINFKSENSKPNKQLVFIIVVLVVISLVIDLLSLNVLYGITDSKSGFGGELATWHPDWDLDGCSRDCYYEHTNAISLNTCLHSCCTHYCDYERAMCLNAGLSGTHCIEEENRCDDDCDNQYYAYDEDWEYG